MRMTSQSISSLLSMNVGYLKIEYLCFCSYNVASVSIRELIFIPKPCEASPSFGIAKLPHKKPKGFIGYSRDLVYV